MNSNEWTPESDVTNALQGAKAALTDVTSEYTEPNALAYSKPRSATAEGLKAASTYLREHFATPHQNGVNRIASGAARGIEAAAHVVEDFDAGQTRDDLANLIRRHPYQALGLGVGFGLLVGKLLRK